MSSFVCQCVVRQMRMEVEGGDAFEPAASVETVGLDKRLELRGALDGCRSQPPTILDGNVETLHKRARVFAEALLARNKRIAVVRILHGALFEVIREADVMVRAEHEAGSFSLEEVLKCLDLFRGGLLFGDQVVETEDHQRVGIVEDALVDGEFLSCLVDALVDGDGMTGDLADKVLKAQQTEMKQFERSRDSL